MQAAVAGDNFTTSTGLQCLKGHFGANPISSKGATTVIDRARWMAPVLGAALLAFTGSAIAQDSANPNDTSAQASSTSKRQKQEAKEANGQSGQERAESNSGSSSGSQLSAHDKEFVKKAAQGGLEEVEIGQMVAQKAESQEVKDFAQRMVDDHGKANDELKSLIQQKGLTPPASMNAKGKALKARLEKLSGEQLDKAYMQSMVKDHTKDVAEFKQAESTAKDPDLKAWVGKTLPTLQEHLKQAKQIATKEANEGGGKKGSQTAQQ